MKIIKTLNNFKLIILLAVLCVLQGLQVKAQNYQDLTSYAGIEVQNANSLDGQGISFYDFNDDGWDDLTFAISWQDPQFYLNNGDNTFTLLAPFFSNSSKIRSILWVDYDNDNDADLFVTYDDEPFELWKNIGEFVFEEISSQAGFLDSDAAHYSASWGDLDRDGLLDIYISTYYEPGQPFELSTMNQVYRNLGNDTFENITINSNTGDGHKSTLATSIWDFNNDLWPDIYSVNDRDMGNGLFRNDSTEQFVDVSWTSNTNAMIFGMSASAADYDNDGDLDMYCTNDADGNILLNNNGSGGFTNSAAFSGTQVQKMSWAASWLDYDNDGHQDLYVCTQGDFDGGWIGGQNLLFENNADGTFTSVDQDVGLSTDTALTYCSAIGDLDRNGFADIAQNNLDPFQSKVFRNSGGDNHFISIELEGEVSNKEAIGTWIKVYANSNTYCRYTHLGENYMGQNSQRQLIGLGDADMCDSLIVLWPSGHIDSFYAIETDQWIEIKEGASIVPQIELTANTFCEGDSILLSTNLNGQHNWSDGSTADSLYVHEQGWYSAQIENSLGLLFMTDSVYVEQSTPLQIEAEISSPSCYAYSNGSISVGISQGEFSEIEWSNGSDQLALDSLGSGIFSCDITDIWGCNDAYSFTVLQPDSLSANVEVQNASCWGENDGFAAVPIEGGVTPYTIESFGADLNNLAAGQYAVLITDSNLCQIEIDITITEPDSIAVEIEFEPINQEGFGSASANISGGIPPYDLLWSNGDTTLTTEIFESSEYWITVTDSMSCTKTYSVFVPLNISDEEAGNIQISPNPFRDFINISSSVNAPIHYQIITSTGAIWSNGIINQSRDVITTNDLSAGIWILRLSQNSKTTHQILVKQ